jgi:hypothetical protein
MLPRRNSILLAERGVAASSIGVRFIRPPAAAVSGAIANTIVRDGKTLPLIGFPSKCKYLLIMY